MKIFAEYFCVRTTYLCGSYFCHIFSEGVNFCDLAHFFFFEASSSRVFAQQNGENGVKFKETFIHPENSLINNNLTLKSDEKGT